jgi:BirA family biotin operon repressor/biotin-[acetyl-CoA-carboxylase] ligase
MRQGSSTVAADLGAFERFAGELRRRARQAGAPLVVLRRVDSTNVFARNVTRRLASDGGPERRVVFAAWEQRAGRGRLGRSWTSAPGLGVYATVVLAPAPSAPPLALLPLVTGIGLCRALRRQVPAVGLKWPNDLVVGGRKLGGILIETLPMAAGRQAALIGFGVNHGHQVSELPTEVSTSLHVEANVVREAGGRSRGAADESLAGLLLELVQGLAAALERCSDPTSILEEYRELTVHRPGEPLRCRVQERSIDGTFLDFDAQGRLRLRCGDETVVVATGDVIEGEPVAREAAGDAPA